MTESDRTQTELTAELERLRARLADLSSRAGAHFRTTRALEASKDALSETEARYRMLVDTMDEGLTVIDERMVLTYVNDRFCDMVGYTRDELMGRRVTDLQQPTSRRVFQQQFSKRREGKHDRYELSLIGKDGRVVHVIVSPRALYDTEGQFAGSFAVVTDVTQLRQAMQAMEESEAKYKALFESAGDAVFLGHAMSADMRFMDCNRRALEMFGAERKELIGVALHEFSPSTQPDGRPSQATATERIAAALNGALQFFGWRYRRLDGTLFDAEVSLNRLSIGDEYHVLAVVRDVTARKQMERALLQEKEIFLSVVQSAPYGVAFLDEGHIIYLNPEATRILGYRLHEIPTVEEAFRRFYPDETYRATMYEAWTASWAPGSPGMHQEASVCCRDGAVKEIEFRSNRLPRGRSIVMLCDITERRRDEARRRAVLEGLRAVASIADELIGSDSLDTLFRRAVELARERLGVERCSLYVQEGEYLCATYGTNRKGETTDEHGYRFPLAKDPLSQRLAAMEAAGTRWTVREDQLVDWNGSTLEVCGNGWVASTLIQSDVAQKRIGAFFNDAAITGAEFDEARQEVVSVFCSLLANIIDRQRAEAALHTMSVEDELTGLYNRRGFRALAEQQIKIARRTQGRMCLVFADMDGLKRTNDTFGHMEGDRALIETADVFREAFREADILARVGGDEFVVLSVATAQDSSECLLDRLSEKLADHNARPGRQYPLAVSVGLAEYDPENPCSLDELLSRADEAMYADKARKAGAKQALVGSTAEDGAAADEAPAQARRGAAS